MWRVPKLPRWLILAALLVVLAPACLTAQEDPDQVPLGDVARHLRKNTPLKKAVIDDDNLPDVMQKVDRDDAAKSSLRFLMKGDSKAFQLASPDVTCSLAFTANVKALLAANQYAQMDLPATEIAKIAAQAVIEGDALTVPVFNGTDWHLSELSVALTVVKGGGSKSPAFDPAPGKDAAATDPALPNSSFAGNQAFEDVRPEKRPDRTVIYRMRTAAPPWARAVFSAPLNLELAQGQEWHWAILEARGYPPQISGQVSQTISPDNAPKFPPDATPVTPMPDKPTPANPAEGVTPSTN
jgi:hypothetical protein